MFIRNVIIFFLLAGCDERGTVPEAVLPANNSGEYEWTKLSDSAGFIPTGDLQFVNIRDTLWLFHPNGNYYSTDGIKFHLSGLEAKLSLSGKPGYLFSNNKLITVVAGQAGKKNDSSSMITYKSFDLLNWNLATKAISLPLIDHSLLIGFKGKIWIFGASDSSDQHVGAWNSDDAVHWTKMADSISFGSIADCRMIVFKKKVIIIF